jgi:hypothetical protein
MLQGLANSGFDWTMSILTELPVDWYPDDAFEGFSDTSSFDPGTARALMWLAQLAYEAAGSAKARLIADRWGVEVVATAGAPAPDGELKAGELNAQVFRKGKSLVVVFQGTDPLRLAHWVIDLDARVKDNVHAGFKRTVETLWPPLACAIDQELKRDPWCRLLFAGHSLGGALAVLAADLSHARRHDVSAVYTFGMPRVGDASFAAAYNARLGRRTYRFVLGEDIVPTVPPPLARFDYRHVGHFLPSADDRFEAGTFTAPPNAAERDDWSNAPRAGKDTWRALVGALRSDLLGNLAELAKLRLGASSATPDDHAARVAEFLLQRSPTPLRDHLPIRYCRALAVN